VGLGLGLSSALFGEFQGQFAQSVYVPISLTDRVLLEPEVGLVRFSEEDGEFDETGTLLVLGAGVLFEIADSGDDRIYAGPRAGIVRFSTSSEGPGGETDDSTTNLSLAGVFGGEYFLKDRFSLGGEVGLEWLDLSDDSDAEGSLISTTAEFRVRWYFP
jgi:hypothetical protein